MHTIINSSEYLRIQSGGGQINTRLSSPISFITDSYVLVNVLLRVHYGNYWTKGCGREANTARASAARKCCIRLETTPLSQIIPVVYSQQYINWFVVHIWSSFELAVLLSHCSIFSLIGNY